MLLHSILAQVSEDLPDATQIPQANPVVAAIFGLLGLAIFVLIIASMWKVFTKAGQPGWASIIPIYNAYILCKIAGKSGWWVLLLLIPFVGIVFAILLCIALAERFGQGAGFGLGLAFLGIIFFPILAFGDYRYRGALPPPPGTPGTAYA